MNITYTLTVGKLHTDYHDDSLSEQEVLHVDWELVGTAVDDQGVERTSAPASGTVHLAPPDNDNYAPYSTLTRSQIRDWVEARLGELAGPEGYTTLWDYLTQQRIDDINYQIQKELEPDPEPSEEEEPTPVEPTL